MKALPLIQRKVVVATDAFVEIVIWKVPRSVPSSDHDYKYRLAYIVGGQSVIRFDNERGKGDHRHVGSDQMPYRFTTPDRLIADFKTEIERWNHEHGRS